VEALTTSPVASPALHHLTLGVLSGVDTWASDPALIAVRTLVGSAADHELAQLPQSIGAVLPLLVGAPERLAIALDAILRLDFYEAADGMSSLVWHGEPSTVLAGAVLAARPDADTNFADLVRAHRQDLSETWKQDLFLTRLEPAHHPTTDSAAADRKVRWPAEDPMSSRFAFAAVQAPLEGFSWRDHLRTVLELVTAGVVVRRLPPKGPSSYGSWLPKWIPVIGPTGRSTLRIRPTPTDRDLRGLVQRVAHLTPNAPQPRTFRSHLEHLAVPEVTSIEAFDDGAMPRPEVAYLAGLRSTQFDGFRKYEHLSPASYRGFSYWTFAQVVGLRASRYLFARSGRKRGLGEIANQLVRLVRENRQVPVAITTTGEVLIKDNGSLYNIETSQLVQEDIISFVDDIYEPFVLPSGQVPRLLRPNEYTTVHPGIIGGLPCVRDTRVSVSVVSNALKASRATNAADPTDFVARRFAILPEAVTDAEHIANDMLAAI